MPTQHRPETEILLPHNQSYNQNISKSHGRCSQKASRERLKYLH